MLQWRKQEVTKVADTSATNIETYDRVSVLIYDDLNTTASEVNQIQGHVVFKDFI